MRIILIQPATQTVTELEHDGQVDWRAIQKYLGNRPMTIAGVLPTGDTLFVDDEGLLNGPTDFFSYQAVNGQPLAGVGVITGPEVDEEIVDAKIPLADVLAGVIFLGRMQATEPTVTQFDQDGVHHIVVKPNIHPA